MNERTGDEVDLADIVKGYDTGSVYVLVEPQELDEIAPGRSRSIDVAGFVDLDTVDPVFFDKTYFVGPRGAQYGKVYALLERALAESNKAGIATFVMRGREYLVALKAEEAEGLLTLHTLHWAAELRDPHADVPDLPEKVEAPPPRGPAQLADHLVEGLDQVREVLGLRQHRPPPARMRERPDQQVSSPRLGRVRKLQPVELDLFTRRMRDHRDVPARRGMTRLAVRPDLVAAKRTGKC